MIVGVPKEIKDNENRVAATPAVVHDLKRYGHRIRIESGAGVGSGISDDEYRGAGAEIVSAYEAWCSDLVLKVKEPQPQECGYFHSGQIIFTYLHLAAAPELTIAMMQAGVVGIAYETVQTPDGGLPLLMPMSEVAGRMAVQMGAQYLEKAHGGRGVLLGGVPGVPSAEVVIIGGGTVGANAARIALGMGAHVTIIDIDIDRLRYLTDVFHGNLITVVSNSYNIARAVRYADLLIGAVLVPGAKAPHLVTADMVATMKPSSVIVDVAVDQGGCIETIDHATTHSDPVYVRHGVIHYAVANMPGVVPRTSTFALTNATHPYVMTLANQGLAAVTSSTALALGINVLNGALVYKAVADAHRLTYTPLADVLEKAGR